MSKYDEHNLAHTPHLCLPSNFTVQPWWVFSSSLKPPNSPSVTGFCTCCLSFSSSFLGETMTIHPLGPSLDKPSPDKPFLNSLVWVRWPAMNYQTPVFFPMKSQSTVNAYYMSLSFTRPCAPWGQEACLFCGNCMSSSQPTIIILDDYIITWICDLQTLWSVAELSDLYPLIELERFPKFLA